MTDEPEIPAEEKVAEPQPSIDEMRASLMGEFDQKLQARDQAMMAAFKELATSLRPQAPVVQEQERHEAPKDFEINSDEFWRDPAAAMNKFYQTKVQPALEKMPKQQEVKPDMSGAVALIEINKIRLKDSVPEEEWQKYAPFLDVAMQRTDPAVLTKTEGIDAVWRLTKSYADDYMRAEEAKKARPAGVPRGGKLNLESGGQNSPANSEKTQLSEEQRVVAEGLGIGPESWKQYEKAEEIDIGVNRRAKK